MPYHLDIRVNSSYKTADLTKEEFERAKGLCENRTNMAGFWKATVMPIRTDLDALLSDLVFPTLINTVIKTEEKANQTFIWISFALIWDAATLPIRLITLIPRICYNAYTRTMRLHPLIPFLREKGIVLVQSDLAYGTLKKENRARQAIVAAETTKEAGQPPLNKEEQSLIFQEGDPIHLFLYETGLPDNELVTNAYEGYRYRLRLSKHREIPAFDVGGRGKGSGGRLHESVRARL